MNKKWILSICLISSLGTNLTQIKNNMQSKDNSEFDDNLMQEEEIQIRILLLNKLDTLAQYFDKDHIFNKEYHNLLKKFFGIKCNDFSTENTINRIQKIFEGLSIFEMRASNDLKYCLDTSIKYLLEYDCDILSKLSNDQVNNIISLSYLVSKILPINFSEENIEYEKISNDPYMWSKILMEFNQFFSELGMINKGKLYIDFEEKIIKLLGKSPSYRMFKACSERIYDKFDGIDCGNNKHKKTPLMEIESSYKSLIKKFEKHSSNEEIKNFISRFHMFEKGFENFYDNQILIKTSLLSLFNADSLFNLMVIARLGDKIDNTLSEKNKILLEKYGITAKFILDEFMTLCKAGKINWKSLPMINLTKNEYEIILSSLSFLGNMDDVLSKELLNKYKNNEPHPMHSEKKTSQVDQSEEIYEENEEYDFDNDDEDYMK